MMKILGKQDEARYSNVSEKIYIVNNWSCRFHLIAEVLLGGIFNYEPDPISIICKADVPLCSL